MFFLNIYFCLSIVDLQCYINFRLQKNVSIIYIYMFFFRLFSFIGYYKISSIVVGAIQ